MHNVINNILTGNNLGSVGNSDLGTGSSGLEENYNVVINMPSVVIIMDSPVRTIIVEVKEECFQIL